MDLRRHLEVLTRFKALIACGVLAGAIFATLTTFRVSWDGRPAVEWRKPAVWQSDSVLFVTQRGFPWGRANLPTDDGAGATGSQAQNLEDNPDQNFADPSRFSGLASIYSYLVRSEPVRRLIPGSPPESAIAAEPFLENANGNGGALPLIGLSTKAPSAAAARQLNRDTIGALLRYLRTEQVNSQTPREQRAEVQVINPPGEPVLAEGHALTGAIVVLLLCLLASVALSYVLENLRMSSAASREAPERLPGVGDGEPPLRAAGR
jgi:hypothetical protein